MAKKKTAGVPAGSPASESPAAAPSARRRRAVSAAPPLTESPSMVNDRAESMPEPAGQRVTTAETSLSDSVTFATTPTDSEPTYEQIAEATYQRYLSRGGSDGLDFDDWIEAERQLKSR